MKFDDLTGKIIGCAIEVHRTLGPGLLESLYQSCLIHELSCAGIKHDSQFSFAVKYKDSNLGLSYRLDLVVEGSIILELKSVGALNSLHESQLVTYLKLSGLKTGLLINFNSVLLKSGIKRIKLD